VIKFDFKGGTTKFSSEILNRSTNHQCILPAQQSSKRMTKLDQLLANSKGQLLLLRTSGTLPNEEQN
jgi:hypothetical protein